MSKVKLSPAMLPWRGDSTLDDVVYKGGPSIHLFKHKGGKENRYTHKATTENTL